jgi:folate-binding Fe-S cluster repair protein YgfZ
MADSAFFCTLSHEGVLAVRGADAGKFLQGQLTCNLNYLSDTQASLGARCTQKGRMQSSFRILLEGDGVLLAMASELLEPQLAGPEKIRGVLQVQTDRRKRRLGTFRRRATATLR